MIRDTGAQYDIDRRSLADRVHSHIKRLILSGELPGGEFIPEATIARSFGVSRTPIREALRRLEEYGLIELKPRSYGKVSKLQPEEAFNIARIRAHLESLAVELLTENGTEADFDELDRLCKECSKLFVNNDIAGTFEKDSELHLEIARRTRNRHLLEIMEKFDAKIQLLRLVLHLPHERLGGYIEQHTRIIGFLRQRDRQAAKLLIEQHIMGQLDDYVPVEMA
jgi:GntR family transcriptional regulator, rspAB operon transcriptional repressor